MNAMNIELARHNMVEQQIRTWDVLDPRVLDLVARAPREDYVPAPYRNLAFADLNLPIGAGQVMMTPKLEARLLQAIEIRPQDKMLEIGTGSGYLTSLLAALGQHVVSVELDPELARAAAERLAAHNVKNVTLEIGDGARGWDKQAPYDVIVITGSLPVLPENFQNSLAPDGRLFAIVGKSPAMEALLVRRLNDRHFETRSLFETDLPPLRHAYEPDRFVF
jgi:protein-L-isoaspartate(D-aspartate) O-methyltransferase